MSGWVTDVTGKVTGNKDSEDPVVTVEREFSTRVEGSTSYLSSVIHVCRSLNIDM